MSALAHLVTEGSSWSHHLAALVPVVTLADMQAHARRFLQHLHVEALVHGNASPADASQLVDLVVGHFKETCNAQPFLASQRRPSRCVDIPEGNHFLFVRRNTLHKSSGVEMVFITGAASLEVDLMRKLVNQVIKEPFFAELRTEKQLGYVVSSMPCKIANFTVSTITAVATI